MSSKEISNDNSSQEFSCHFCPERLTTPDDMRTHLEKCASKTNQCPHCNKYIRRSIFAYHLDSNCSDLNFFDETTEATASLEQVESKNARKFQPLFEKRAQIDQTLEEKCYPAEIDHVREKLQFNVIVMGSPRVGKSTLINALCDQNQAKTSTSLDSCTQQITRYTLKDNQQRTPNGNQFEINFYDTPGIETWKDNAGEITMLQFIEKTNPLCVIYCASPGSFSSLQQLRSILEYCKSKDIFCALVCTNMWSSSKRHDVINEFEKQLTFFGEKEEKQSFQRSYSTPHQITFFGKGALCTMVNSETYSDKELLGNKTLPVQGIDELIHGIMESLDQDKLLGWCYAVLYRRSYWQIITQKLGGFFQLRFVSLYNLIASSYEGTANNFANFFSKQSTERKNT